MNHDLIEKPWRFDPAQHQVSAAVTPTPSNHLANFDEDQMRRAVGYIYIYSSCFVRIEVGSDLKEGLGAGKRAPQHCSAKIEVIRYPSPSIQRFQSTSYV